MYEDLDKVNEKILSLLKENARISSAEIGRILGISHTAVIKRIRRLEQTGEITGYTLRGKDPAKRIRYMLQIKTAPGKADDAIRALEGERWVTMVMRCSTRDSLVMFTSLKNEYDLRVMMRAIQNEEKSIIDWTAVGVDKVKNNLTA